MTSTEPTRHPVTLLYLVTAAAMTLPVYLPWIAGVLRTVLP